MNNVRCRYKCSACFTEDLRRVRSILHSARDAGLLDYAGFVATVHRE